MLEIKIKMHKNNFYFKFWIVSDVHQYTFDFDGLYEMNRDFRAVADEKM